MFSAALPAIAISWKFFSPPPRTPTCHCLHILMVLSSLICRKCLLICGGFFVPIFPGEILISYFEILAWVISSANQCAIMWSSRSFSWIRFWKSRNKKRLCTSITLFCTFLDRCSTTATWNFLILLAYFMEWVSTTQFFFPFSKLRYGPFGFNPQNVVNIWQIKWN